MRTSEQETGHPNMMTVVSAPQQRREARLDSTLKTSNAAWAGRVGLALLFLAGLAHFVFDSTDNAQPVAYATISAAAAAMPSAEYAVAARIGEAAAAPGRSDPSLPAGYANPGGGGDGNVMTFEHD